MKVASGQSHWSAVAAHELVLETHAITFSAAKRLSESFDFAKATTRPAVARNRSFRRRASQSLAGCPSVMGLYGAGVALWCAVLLAAFERLFIIQQQFCPLLEALLPQAQS
jgi:hypothetical protein